MLKVLRCSLAFALALLLVAGPLPLSALAEDAPQSAVPESSDTAPEAPSAPPAAPEAPADEAPGDDLTPLGPQPEDAAASSAIEAPLPEAADSEAEQAAEAHRPDQPVAVASANGITLSISVESVYSIGSTFTGDILAVTVRAENAGWTTTGSNPGVHAIQYHLSYDASKLNVNTNYGVGGTVASSALPSGWDFSCNASGGSVIVLLTAPNPATPWPIGNNVIATSYFVVAGSGSNSNPTTLNFGLPATGRLVSYLENPADPTSRYLAADITNGNFGSIQIKDALNGWQTIGGATYYFANRVVQKGWQSIGGATYHFDEATGVMTTGWAALPGGNYYFSPAGVLATGTTLVDGVLHMFTGTGMWMGKATPGWNGMDGHSVHVNNDGTLTMGWMSQDGSWYYLDPNNNGYMADGPTMIGGQLNLFNASGVWQGTSNASGWISTTAGWAYLQNGTALTGWLLIDGVWYYMYPTSGVMATGGATIGGQDYFFAGHGGMVTGWALSNGTWYYYGGSGAKALGWVLTGQWYYMDPAADGAMATGHFTIGGAEYFFAPSGAMITGWLADTGGWYFYNTSGAKVTGWLLEGGNWYYMNPENSGLMVTGRFTINGVVNIFDADGRWQGEA